MRKFLEVLFKIVFYGANIVLGGYFLLATVVSLTTKNSQRPTDVFALWPLLMLACVSLSYVVNIIAQRALKARDFSPGFRALLTISLWTLRLTFVYVFAQSLKHGSVPPPDILTRDNLFIGPVLFGLLILIWVLWYGKIAREKIEGAFILRTLGFARDKGGGAREDSAVADILETTDLIKQEIFTTKGDSFQVELPLIVAWPETPAHYFGVHILRTYTRTSHGLQMAADWTACWLGAADGAPFEIRKTFRGFDVEGRDLVGDHKIESVTEVMQANDLDALRVRDGRYLAVKKLKTRFVFFGIRAPEPRAIESVAESLKFLKGAVGDSAGSQFKQ